jgi:hypothetical protein
VIISLFFLGLVLFGRFELLSEVDLVVLLVVVECELVLTGRFESVSEISLGLFELFELGESEELKLITINIILD